MATITELLKKVHESPDRLMSGICSQKGIIDLETPAFELLKEVMAKWPKSTGERLYPVPVSENKNNQTSPATAYYFHKNLWDRDTEYGRLRWELLEWLIEQPELNAEADSIWLIEQPELNAEAEE